MDQLSCLHAKDKVKEMAEIWTPVQIYTRLLSWREGQFSLVGRLGCALLSVHNSSSMAERDFSLQVLLNLNLLLFSLKIPNLLELPCGRCQEEQDKPDETQG